MLHWYRADMHIHTVLSACSELTMGPRDIVRQALEQKCDIIAITDHNSAENVPAVLDAAQGKPLTVIPGMEVCTREDAHMICLFKDLENVFTFQDFIYSHLPEGKNDESFFGPQIVCDKDENILGKNEKLLSFSTNASLKDIVEQVINRGGIVYPAHVDRKSNSLLRVLGFIPTDLPIYAAEIADMKNYDEPNIKFLEKSHYSIINSSDAHDLKRLGQNYTWCKLQEPTFDELEKAIKKQDDRYLSVKDPIDINLDVAVKKENITLHTEK